MTITYAFTLADIPTWLICTTVVIFFIIGHYIWLQLHRLLRLLFPHAKAPGDGFQQSSTLFPHQRRDRKSSTSNRSELEMKMLKLHDKLVDSISSTEFTCRQYTQHNIQNIVSNLEEVREKCFDYTNQVTTPVLNTAQNA